ncbi:hypothetical protein SBX64_12500 [Vibrio rhizosphaerae]|uniref:Amidase n=1 Tax=Vibrio rhizosphaerae TaxID=398736 RepID=A0ABU4IVD7_9VIBR|nr:hypothetical protein [Vibrio rhizosphaerae]MDW6093367.1 hypothetical protein [Vibrio rhizosphaerae]
MKNHIIMLTVTALMAGCATKIIDHSDDIAQECYKVAMPSFLYQARCADLSATIFGNSSICTGIQAFDPSETYWSASAEQYIYFPSSWAEYEKDIDSWNTKLFLRLLFEDQRKAIAPIPTGTKIRVTGIYDYPRGEHGHILIVKAMIDSGPNQGTEVELKTPYSFADNGPDWIFRNSDQQGPRLTSNPKYLKPCP